MTFLKILILITMNIRKFHMANIFYMRGLMATNQARLNGMLIIIHIAQLGNF